MITLVLTPAVHTTLKNALTRVLPDVKASHRAEALSRALGFSCNAALVAALKTDAPKRVPDSALFSAYLCEHNFSADPNVIHKVAAMTAVADVRRRHRSLGYYGFGPGHPQRLEDRFETWPETRRRFRGEQEEMADLHFAEAFLRSMAVIEHIPKTKTIRPRCDSHWLKHIAEKYPCLYPDGRRLGSAYVPSGALIAAAIYAGFDCGYGADGTGYMHPQGTFNMSYPAALAIECQVNPDGARASDYRAKKEYRARRRLGYRY